MSDYDSDETVGADSDETLPPESRDELNYSPDLFDEIPDPSHSKSSTKQNMKKRRSNAHDLSESDTESESDIRQKYNKSDSKIGDKPKENKQDRKESEFKSSKTGQKDKQKDRQKFIQEFLDMSGSDSDKDDQIDNHKHNLKKVSTPTSATKTKTYSPGHVQSTNLSVSGKPYKKDYSKPYTDTKPKSSTNGELTKPRQRETVKEKHDSKFSGNKSFRDNMASSPKGSLSSAPTLKRKHSRSPVPNALRKAVTEIINKTEDSQDEVKPKCKYGSDCYRKNPSHFEEYSHPAKKSKSFISSSPKDSTPPTKKQKMSDEIPSTSRQSQHGRSTSPSMTIKSSSPSLKIKTPEQSSRSPSSLKTPKTISEKFDQAQPYSFFLTKVAGIDNKYNSSYAMDIKEILSPDMGNLKSSCQFNFMFEIPWLVKQYPAEFRSKPLLIVHGEQGPSKAQLQADAMTYTNIKFCQAKLEMMYGTHHTKMMLLLYDTGMRVVIHTSNLIERDWYQKTQGIWISPVFPKLVSPSKEKGDSPTFFKKDLINYIQAYKAYQLKEWIEHIEHHDMSAARAVIVGSVPGRHQGDSEKFKWGHLKLRKVLKQHGPDPSIVKTWPVIGQFSSIGSMGANKENWLCGEYLESLAATKMSSGLQSNVRLQLIFPSKDNVRLSLEGFPAGGSIPYSVNTAKKQPYLHDFFHVWKSEGRGRSRAMPHIKTYIRPKQDGTVASWFMVTSANLSKAAWGAFEKKGAQLMIRSYEIGVLFLPKFFDSGDVFGVTSDIDTARRSQKLLIPYDLPAQKYEKKDRPWMWDIPYMDLPDTNGNVWCPFSK